MLNLDINLLNKVSFVKFNILNDNLLTFTELLWIWYNDYNSKGKKIATSDWLTINTALFS